MSRSNPFAMSASERDAFHLENGQYYDDDALDAETFEDYGDEEDETQEENEEHDAAEQEYETHEESEQQMPAFLPSAIQSTSPERQQSYQQSQIQDTQLSTASLPSQNQFYTPSETSHLAQKLIAQLKHINIAAAIAESSPTQNQLPLPLYEIILILNTYRLDCQKRHQYKECDTIDRILRAIRIAEEKRHVESLRSSQHAERMHLDMQHRVEMDQLVKLWETRFMDFNTYIQELRNSMSERHIQEFEQFKLKFNFELNRVPKFSKRVLNMRAVERTLVGQKKFREAEKVKKKANIVQNQELIEKSQRIAERFEKQKELLLKRHNKEADALQLKIDKIRHDLEQGKDKDFTNAQRRYQNTLQNISKNQNIIMKKTLRYIKTHEHNTKLSGIASTKLPDMRESLNSQQRLSGFGVGSESTAIQQERQHFFNSRSTAQDDAVSVSSSRDSGAQPVWAKEKRSKSRGAVRSQQQHRLGAVGRSRTEGTAVQSNGRHTAIGVSRSRSTQPARSMRSHSSMEIKNGAFTTMHEQNGDLGDYFGSDTNAPEGNANDMQFPPNRKLSPIKSRRHARMKRVAQVYQSKPFGMAGDANKKKDFVF